MARRHISRLRGRESFRRRAGQKPPRSITLIVCEGETEQAYLDAAQIHYGLSTAEVVIVDDSRGSAPISVVEYAEGRCAEPGGYDKVFCVFDRNGHTTFDQAREKIRQLKTRARNPLPMDDIVSVPCFEVWVLLHFERTARPFARCADVIHRIRNAHLRDYEKADAEIALELMKRLETAKANAAWVAEQAATNNYNPFTGIHQIIAHFSKVAIS